MALAKAVPTDVLQSTLAATVRAAPEYGHVKSRDCDRVEGSASLLIRKKLREKVVVVTAFDSTHAAVAQKGALASLRCAQVPVEIFDLGISPAIRKVLSAQFPPPLFNWREFNFDLYPDHFRMGRAHTTDGAGEYAWKVAAISEIAAERPTAKLLWTDGGNWISPNLISNVEKGLWFSISARNGILARTSGGTVGQWAFHGKAESMWAYFNATNKVARCSFSSKYRYLF